MGQESYRLSHSSEGYGEHYSRTYESGFYAEQWRSIERPLLEDVLRKLARKPENTKALDFACGTGRILKVVESVFNDSTGVDVSESMLSVARSEVKNSTLIRQDITHTPLDGEYDVITAFRFLLNAEPELAADALAALRAAIAPTGTFIVNIHVNSISALGVFYR